MTAPGESLADELLEDADRQRRVRSAECPRCGAGPGEACIYPKSKRDQTVHHQARWDAWYAAHPEAAS